MSGPVPHDTGAPERDRRRAGRREWSALAVVVLAVVLLSIDGTVLSLAVPSLTADLAPTATQLLWIGDVYSFALAGLLVTMGTVADRIGRKRLLLIGATGFGAASVLAAFAPSAEWLIAARVLLGVAGATLMPSTLSIIRSMFADDRQRTTAIAVWSAAAGGGAAVGPLVGGVLLDHFWWGSVFVVNVPVIAVLVIAGSIIIPESRDPRPGRFDLLSAALSLAGMLPLVYAIKHTASEGPDAIALLAAVVGAVALVIFIRRQLRLRAPLIDVSLFRRPAFAGAISTNLISIFAFSGLLFFFSQYLQLVRGYSPLQAGIRELPGTLASIAAIAVITPLVTRLGRGRSIGVGLLIAGAGLGGLAVAEDAPSYVWLALALALIGLGIGIAFTLTTDAVVASVPPSRAGAASAVSETAYELGVALGIAVLGSLQTVVYRLRLDLPTGLSDDTRSALRESLAVAVARLERTAEPGTAALLEHVRHAFTQAMQTTSVVGAGLLLVAAVLAWRVIPSPRD